MRAEIKPFTAILSASDVRFQMPVYQRGYSWTTQQREELWDDILHAGEHDRQHFLGSILVQDTTAERSLTGLRTVYVIDGQQRLTTITLLLHEFFDYLMEHPECKPESIGRPVQAEHRDFVFNVERQGDERYRLIPSDADRQTLWSIIGDEPEPKDPNTNMVQAANDFRVWVQQADPNVVWRGIRNLQSVEVCLGVDDDAQTIFESMNAKGMDLQAVDLIRNWMLLQTVYEHDGDRDEQRTFYRNRWQPFQKRFLHTGKTDDIESFILQWMFSFGPKRRKGADTYRLFKDLWVDNAWTADTAMTIMEENADAWERIFLDGEENPTLAEAYRRVRVLKVTQIRPLMLALHTAMREGRLSEKEMVKSCGIIESFLIRRAASRMYGSIIQTLIGRMILMTNATSSNIPLELAAIILAQDPASPARCPSDKEFRHSLLTGKLYNKHAIAKPILVRLEDSLHPQEHIDDSNLTIEHIMPQNLDEAWRKRLGSSADRINNEYGNTLGNLTLTGANSALSNHDLADKQDMPGLGYKASPLSINQLVRDSDDWNSDAILKRGSMLADQAIKVWPLPHAPNDLIDKYRKEDYGARPSRTLASAHPLLAPGGDASKPFEQLSDIIHRDHPDWIRIIRKIAVNWSTGSRNAIVVQAQANGSLKCYLDYMGDDPLVERCVRTNPFRKDYQIRLSDGFDSQRVARILNSIPVED